MRQDKNKTGGRVVKTKNGVTCLSPEGALAAVDPEELVSSDATAGLLGVRAQTLIAWRCDDRGPPYIKIGRSVWYRRADIAAFIGAQRCVPGGA